jgi:hypothetical protein
MNGTAAPLTALVLNCTLTPSPGESSTQLLADQLLAALGKHGVTGDTVRLVDHAVAPGVEGRLRTFGKVGVAVVVGNEDGAHKITADLFQALNDCGWSVPANGGVYWNGEALSGVDYKDLDETPEAVASTTATVAANAAHLASVLRERPYPPAS